MGEFPSGQRGQTVNLLSVTSVVRIHLPPPLSSRRLRLLDNFLRSDDSRAGSWRYAGVAFPQKSGSTVPHQKRADESQLVLFALQRLENVNAVLAVRRGCSAACAKITRLPFRRKSEKISSSPRADSICSISLFFARPPAPGRRIFFFCCGTLCRRTGIGGVRRGQTEEEARRGMLTSTKNLLAKSRYHKNLAMSRIKLQVSCYN